MLTEPRTCSAAVDKTLSFTSLVDSTGRAVTQVRVEVDEERSDTHPVTFYVTVLDLYYPYTLVGHVQSATLLDETGATLRELTSEPSSTFAVLVTARMHDSLETGDLKRRILAGGMELSLTTDLPGKEQLLVPLASGERYYQPEFCYSPRHDW